MNRKDMLVGVRDRVAKLLTAIDRERRLVVALTIVLLAGAVLQAFVAVSLWGMSDEGAYIQTSLAINHGGFPLATFPGRPEPVLPLLMAPFLYVFGYGLLVGRSVIILINVVTAMVLALIARRVVQVHKGAAAIAAAAIYLMAPLPATQGPVILEEPVAAMFISISLYFLIRQRWKISSWNYPVSGLFLGVAILSRRSAVIVGFAWLAWILYSEKGWRTRLLSAIRCFWPGVVLVGAFFLAVIKETSFSWVMTTLSVERIGSAPTLPARIEIVGYLLFVATPLLLIPAALVINMLRGTGYARLATMVTILSATGITVLLALYPFYAQWGLGELLTPYLMTLIAATLVVWFAIVTRENFVEPGPVPIDHDIFILVAGWGFLFVCLDFFARSDSFSVYYADGLAPLALFFGIWFTTLIPREDPVPAVISKRKSFDGRVLTRKVPAIAIVLLLTILSSMTALMVLGPTNPQNVRGAYGLHEQTIFQDPGVVIQNVGNYLNRNVRSNDTIFTFDPIFADTTGREISPPVAQFLDKYLDYLHSNGPPYQEMYPDAPPGFLPSIDGLLSYWNSTQLTWLVDGPQTAQAMTYSHLLGWYFNTFYHPVASYGDPLSYDQVIILERGAPPVPSVVHEASVVSGSQPRALTEMNGTVYAASASSSNLTYYNPDGQSGTLNISFKGALSLGAFFGYLWVGSASSPQIEILSPNGTWNEQVSVGNAPSAFIVDKGRGMVFVSAMTGDTVTALEQTANDTWWQVVWSRSIGRTLTSMALNESSSELYVASAGTDMIYTLDEMDGTFISNASLSFQPNYIAHVDGGIDAARSSGGVYRLGIESNGSMQIVTSVTSSGGIWDLVSLPSIDAVAFTSSSAGTISILGASTLASLGGFSNITCPNAMLWNFGSNMVATSESCGNLTNIWQVPAPVNLTMTGLGGEAITLSSSPLVEYQLPVTLHLWPQVVSVQASLSGYLPGFAVFTLEPGEIALDIPVSMGPLISGIYALQLEFTVEIAVMSVLVFFGATVLVLRAGRFSKEQIGA